MVAYSEELGSAIEIESISLKVASGTKVHLDALQIYLGHTDRIELEEEFEGNYIGGTKTLVYDHSDLWLYAGAPGEWFTIQLDESFWYNGSDNLIIEFDWPGGENAIYVWGWISDVNRSLYGEYGNPVGTQTWESLLVRLNGSLSLEPTTFGAIKSTLGL